MSLETGKVVVETAIKKTEGLFNKKAVADAAQKFSEYSGEAEKTVTKLQDTVQSQTNQILSLNKAGEEAANKLKEAQAQITYANQAREEAQQQVKTAKTEMRKALNRKYQKREDLGKGQIKTTYSKARTGFQAEVVSKPGSDEVVVDATLGDGATKKKFKYNKKTKTIETITETKPSVVSITPGQTEKGVPFVRKEYSNGVTETCYPKGEDNSGYKEIFTKARDGHTVLKFESFSADGARKFTRERIAEGHSKEITDNESIREIKEEINDKVNGRFCKYFEKDYKQTGQKVKYEREVDDFGIVKPTFNIEITCPNKTKAIKGTINAYESNNHVLYKNAEAEMEDGTKLVFYNFNGQVPQAYKITTPAGKEDIIANRHTVESQWARLGFYFR